MRHGLASLGIVLLATAAMAAEPDPPSALASLPVLPKPQPAAAQKIAGLTIMAPGIRIAASGAVVLDGHITKDQGPVDGLEVLACLQGGKNHETVITLDTGSAEFVAAACKGALGATDGQPVSEGYRFPARGIPMRLSVQWEDPAKSGAWVEIDGSSLIRDRFTDRPYPALPFIYTGSRFVAVPVPGPDGKVTLREQFMLSSTRSIAVIYDEPDALLASPCPDAWRDHHYEVYSAIAPPVGTPVQVVLTRTTLPLTLTMNSDGALQADGTTLDDAALTAVLTKYFGPGTKPNLRSVGVAVDGKISHERDTAARSRILTIAAKAKLWVVPVFILR